MSKTFKSNTINHKNSLQFFHDLEPSCKFLGGVFLKASQDWKVARNLMSPFDLIFFRFPCGNGVAKPVISYSEVKIFRCLQKMMTGCRILGRHYFGRNLRI